MSTTRRHQGADSRREQLNMSLGVLLPLVALVLSFIATGHFRFTPGGRPFVGIVELGLSVGLSLWGARVPPPNMRALGWAVFAWGMLLVLGAAWGLYGRL